MMTLKQTALWLSVLTMGVSGYACSGTSDEDPAPDTQLVLTPSKSTLTADGSDAVTFTVLNQSVDVTSQATIRCTTDNTAVTGASFSTSKAGTYNFVATYGESTSPSVKLTATAPTTTEPSQFVRNICVMEFTGQWCAICPSGYNYMMFIIGRNYPETAHVIALHDNTTDTDIFALPVQATMAKAFGVTAYPSAVTDLRDLCPLSGDTGGSFRTSLKTSDTEYPAHCGVALKSVYDEGTKTATVTARVFSEKTENYRLTLFVVEDPLVGEQNVGGYYEQNYTHHHVARRLVSATYTGDSLGEIQQGQEGTKTYSIALDPAWNPANTSIYAMAIGANGYINNMITCAIVNGETDYERVTE